jgi:hypothetical protein
MLSIPQQHPQQEQMNSTLLFVGGVLSEILDKLGGQPSKLHFVHPHNQRRIAVELFTILNSGFKASRFLNFV